MVVISLFFPALSFAAPRIEAVTLDLPYVGRYHVGGFSDDVETIAGIRMGLYFSEEWGMELYDIVRDINKNNEGGERYGHLTRLEVDRHFHYGKWVPFLALGGGGVKLQPRNGGDFIPVLDYGGGLKYFFWKSDKPQDSWRFDSAALRFDLRLLHIFDTDIYTDLEYTVGLHFVFRPKKRVEALPLPPLAPVVKEEVALAPPPPPVVVEEKEAVVLAPPPPVVEEEVVKEEVILAPPPPVVEEEVVKPTLPPAPVEPPVWLPRIVYFNFDKSALTRTGEETVEKIARWLTENPTVKVWLHGHTDQQGTNRYNDLLAEKRVKRVMKALVSLGIANDRLSISSSGEEQLVCFKKTLACHAENRRVEWGIVP